MSATRTSREPAGACRSTGVDEVGADERRGQRIEDEPQRRGLMIPASMGLRCQVPVDLDAFTVTASWGMYEPVGPSEDEKDAGRSAGTSAPRSRSPRRITVAEPARRPTTTDFPLKDKVVLRIDRYDDPERGCRLIEMALCNDRETPRKIPVNAWLYQTKLSSTAGGADGVPAGRRSAADDRPEQDDELRRLNLQYRDRLEFAVGRTCSVDWEVADG